MSTPAVVIPDIEAFLVTYLGSRLPTVHVGTKRPNRLAGAWIRVTLLDPRDVGALSIDYLLDYLVQFDCYAGNGGSSVEASGLARTARGWLLAMEGRQPGLTVSKVEFVSGPKYEPDTSEEPALDRYILTTSVTAHV